MVLPFLVQVVLFVCIGKEIKTKKKEEEVVSMAKQMPEGWHARYRPVDMPEDKHKGTPVCGYCKKPMVLSKNQRLWRCSGPEEMKADI